MTTTQILNVTDTAAEQIKARLNEAGDGVIGLRVGIKAKGCSGMAYFMEYAKAKAADDEVVEKSGVTLFVDPASLMYLLGTTIDYVVTDTGEGFEFINPNERGRCGCGESFHTH
jgi:iron-sulfur cluster assembly accessory protein